MKVLETIGRLVLLAILTLLTQVGGFVLCIYWLVVHGLGWNRGQSSIRYRLYATLLFIGLWAVATFALVPLLAKPFGRVPMPLYATEMAPIRPANWIYVLANRHYVKPELRTAVTQVIQAHNQTDVYTELLYLDANFPFWTGFPLLPHRSHDDGEKLDLQFLYKDTRSGARYNGRASWLTYGFSEAPRSDERDQSAACLQQGYWQYDLLRRVSLNRKAKWLKYDAIGNKRLLQRLAQHPSVGKIFIEPYLRSRLGLGGFSKIRFHGCAAVRHDDHIHVQL